MTLYERTVRYLVAAALAGRLWDVVEATEFLRLLIEREETH